jgi:hypothetical protein
MGLKKIFPAIAPHKSTMDGFEGVLCGARKQSTANQYNKVQPTDKEVQVGGETAAPTLLL